MTEIFHRYPIVYYENKSKKPWEKRDEMKRNIGINLSTMFLKTKQTF